MQADVPLQESKKVENYRFTLIACISMHEVVSAQMLKGGTDAVVFENFMYETVCKVRSAPATRNKTIVMLMDNAPIHNTESVRFAAQRLGVVLLMNAEYSPWLNPIEQLFNHLKKRVRAEAQGRPM